MKMVNTLLLIILSILLSACETTIKKSETTLIVPPDELLIPCVSNTPPDKEEYLRSNLKDREQLLIEYSIKQNTVIAKCNNTITVLKDWKVKQKGIYGKD